MPTLSSQILLSISLGLYIIINITEKQDLIPILISPTSMTKKT